MRVLVDTSAWVDFLTGFPSPEHEALRRLIEGDDDLCTCGIVVAEVFQGLRGLEGRSGLAELFGELTFLEPSGIDTYLRAAEIYRELRSRGRTVRSTIDCLIAVLAEAQGCCLLHKDRDLDSIVDSGLVEVERWPGGNEVG